MPVEPLTVEERRLLLLYARLSIEKAVEGEEFELPDLSSLPTSLTQEGVCFVTLTLPGDVLRGCIGGLEPIQPLVVDVCKHAAAAALDDYRFSPVQKTELPYIQIEISRLTAPEPLIYENPSDLPRLLHPYIDGVVLHDGHHRATFLPQVWHKIPEPEVFLNHLCQKMGAPGDLWRRNKLQVEIYLVEEFKEKEM